MDHSFWHERWTTGQIGFHEAEENAHLSKHNGVLGQRKRVLVPLCGKAIDMTYLAAYGHEVIGVELVERAAKAFFAELGGEPEVTRVGEFVRYAENGITLFVGDFFKTTRELLGEVDALYDRAALIALPEAMRREYAKHVRLLMPANAPGLLVTVEYPQDLMNGPPFSVTEAEVSALYPSVRIEKLDDVKAGGNPRLQQAGAREKSFRLTF